MKVPLQLFLALFNCMIEKRDLMHIELRERRRVPNLMNEATAGQVEEISELQFIVK